MMITNVYINNYTVQSYPHLGANIGPHIPGDGFSPLADGPGANMPSWCHCRQRSVRAGDCFGVVPDLIIKRMRFQMV